MPNSIIQTLTAVEKDGLDDLSGLGVVVLLGMFAKVRQSAPGETVFVSFSEILEMIGELKSCSQTVSNGVRKYTNERFSPKMFSNVKKIIDSIFNIRYCKTETRNGKSTESWLPVFSEYGFEYSGTDGPLDLEHLPEDLSKVNVCEDCCKPVYKLQRKKSGRFLSPERFFFRMESGLVAELLARKNTISFTAISRKIFSLLKRLGRTKTLVRLVLLILRQRKAEFSRKLEKLFSHLGFDTSHKSRSLDGLSHMLDQLKSERFVSDFQINGDRLCIQWNQKFFMEEGQSW